MAKAARKFTGWDARVKEARRDPVVLDVDGTEVTIHQPTGRTVRELGKVGDDIDAMVTVLFGEDQAKTVLEAYEDAPFNVLTDLIADLMDEFGLTTAGNPRASRN